MIYKHDQEIEVSGELVELSSRFYSEGWGFGTLRLHSGRMMKITGTLQSRTVGENLVVKGRWNTTGKYGPQLEAEMIALDVKNGTTSSIKAWMKKIAKATASFIGSEEPDLLPRLLEAADTVCGFVEPHLRWDTLSSEIALVALNVPDAAFIAEAAKKQLEVYRKVEQLQKWGFNDREIHRIGDKRILDLNTAKDLYELVTEPTSFSFHRLDHIACFAFDVELTADERMRAGICWTMIKAHEDGHTAVEVSDLGRRAADILQLYPPAVLSWLLVQDLENGNGGNTQLDLKLYGDVIQTAQMAGCEATIASYMREARQCSVDVKREVVDATRHGAAVRPAHDAEP